MKLRLSRAPWTASPLLLLALSLGCQRTVVTEPTAPATVSVNGTSASPPGRSASGTGAETALPIEQALKSDPCAARLHDISGAMLQYFAINNRLPKTPQELAPFADADRPLAFTCPVTGEPYTYVPEGLRSAEDGRQIVLHDAKGHAGTRWAVMLQRPRGPQAAATWVVPMTERDFGRYAPAKPGAEVGRR